jgi:hypothetical protein
MPPDSAPKPAPNPAPGPADASYDLRAVTTALCALYEARCSVGGRIRVEDLLSAASAVCGEACIAVAGEVDPTHHAFTPGSVVMSDRVNTILASDTTEWSGTGSSVFGLIRTGAIASGYSAGEMPPLADVFRAFAAGVGGKDAAEWGFVPLSVPADNRPRIQPVRDAYELRPAVRRALGDQRVPVADWAAVTALAVVTELGRVRDAIDHRIALRLVLDTVNGMAKTAPMTDEAFKDASR